MTKSAIYELGDDQQGQPVEEVLGAALPAFLKGAKVYEVGGRKIVARPDDEAISAKASYFLTA